MLVSEFGGPVVALLCHFLCLTGPIIPYDPIEFVQSYFTLFDLMFSTAY